MTNPRPCLNKHTYKKHIYSILQHMARHLKSIIENRLKGMISYYAPHSEISASHRRGVRYIVPIEFYTMFYGAMNTVKEGHKYKKHIVVRRVPRRGGHVLQLYTYRFPKTWSAACVANRNLIKEAQRRAHALEHDHSLAALEWRIRFFHHYYTVFRGGAKPEPGMKRYSRFYQYTYVAIYRELKAALKQAEEVSFEPISEPETSYVHHSLYGCTSALPQSGLPPKVRPHRAAYMRHFERFFANHVVPPLPDY